MYRSIPFGDLPIGKARSQLPLMDTQDIRRLRLAELIRDKYGSQAAFIAQTGENQGEVSALLKTKSFGEKKARKLEEKCGLPSGWLDAAQLSAELSEIGHDADGAERRSTKRRSTDLAPAKSGEIVIPQYREIGGSMGNGLLLRDQPGEIQGWRVTPEWVQKNVPAHTGVQNLCIVTGFGPSMRPLFNPGDPLLVDRGVTTADRDGIYFFRVGDEGFIKHLQRIPGVGLVAISENKIYRDWTITKDMDFEVFALVIKVWCGTDF